MWYNWVGVGIVLVSVFFTLIVGAKRLEDSDTSFIEKVWVGGYALLVASLIIYFCMGFMYSEGMVKV